MSKLKKKTSMQDIAESLGISKNAVSLALNDKGGVSQELKEKVLQAAQELEYGGLVKKQKSRNIIVLIPEYIINDTYFYNTILWSIEKEAKYKNYNVVLTCVNPEMEQKLQLPNVYYEMSFGGIIIIGVFHDTYVEKIISLNMPLLSVDHSYDDFPIDSVVTANADGAYTAVKYLIEKGHTRIGYIGSVNMTTSLYERWQGYQKAMKKYNIPINEDYSILASSPLAVLLNDPDELEKYINFDNLPTAWFCGGDRIAISLISVLQRRNIKVPDDISVIGFDDLQISSMITPALSTMRVDKAAFGKKAIDYLIERIINEKEERKLKLELYTDIVLRDSVKSLNRA